MGLFTEKQEIKDMTPKEVSGSRSYLYELLKKYSPGESPDFPVMQVAGLSDTENALQGTVSDLATNGSEGYNLAMDYVKGTLANNTNPVDDPRYQALKDEMQALNAANNADVRRQAQKGGMARSTPSGGIQAGNTNTMNRTLATALAQLYGEDLDRKASAASQAQSLGSQKVQETGQLASLASIPRTVENTQNQAIYESLMNELLFPYQQQLAVTRAINGLQPTYVQTGSGMTDLGAALSLAAPVAGGLFAGAGAAAGGGSTIWEGF